MRSSRLPGLSGVLAFFWLGGAAHADVRSVGPGKTHAAPCAAFAAAADGDVIEIDAAGSYVGDVCTIARSRLTIRGVGGRAHIEAGGKSAAGKAIWVVQGSDTVLEDIELSGYAATSASARSDASTIRPTTDASTPAIVAEGPVIPGDDGGCSVRHGAGVRGLLWTIVVSLLLAVAMARRRPR